MSLQPKIRRILTLPSLPPVSSNGGISHHHILRQLHHKIQPSVSIHVTATADIDSNENAVGGGGGGGAGGGGIPRHMIQHPVLPLVAYAFLPTVDHSTPLPPPPMSMMIVVQDVMTNEIIISISWYELYLAYCHAMSISSSSTISIKNIQSQMGIQIKSLQFHDLYTVQWSTPSSFSRFTTTTTTTHTASSSMTHRMTPQLLMIQTEKCLLFVNLRRGTCHTTTTTGMTTVTLATPSQVSSGGGGHVGNSHSILYGYCNERTLRGTSSSTPTPSSSSPSCVPSSNVLPLSTTNSNHQHPYVLIGCNDGTMKVIDYTNNTILKRIKGLGKSDYVVQLLYADSYANHCSSNNTNGPATTTTTTTLSSKSTLVRPKRILTVTKRGYIYMIEIMIHDHANTTDTGSKSTEPASTSSSSSSFTIDVLPPMARLYVPTTSLVDANSDDPTLTSGSSSDSNGVHDSMDHSLYQYDPHLDKFYWLVPASSSSSVSSSSNVTASNSATPASNNTIGPILYVWDFKTIFRNHKNYNGNITDDKTTPMLKPEPTMTVRFPSIVTLGHSNLLSPTTASTTISASNTISSNTGGVTADLTTTTKTSALTTPSKDDTSLSTTTTNTIANTKYTILTGIVHPAFHEDTVVAMTLSSTGDLCLYGAAVTSFINTSNVNSAVQAAPCMAIHIKQLILKQLLQYQNNDDPNILMMVEQIELKVYGATTCTLQSPSCCGPCISVATSWGIFNLELPIYSNPHVHSRCTNGNRIVHYGAGLGSYGKSIISVQQNGYITYASMDILQSNPTGYIEPKNVVKIYESHNSSVLITEHQRHRPFRYAPLLLPSPSGNFICFFHHCEYRYEIYTTSSLIQQVGQARAMAGKNTNAGVGSVDVLQHRNLMVTSGTGICDFAWIADDDVFSILHASDLQEYMHLNVPKQIADASGLLSPNLKFINAGMGAATNLAKTVTKTATTTAQSATKLATSAAVTTTTKTVGVTTKAIISGAKGVKKTFGIFGKRKKDEATGAMSMTTSVDEDDEVEDTADMSTTASTKNAAAAAMLAMQQQQTPSSAPTGQNKRQRYIELKKLELTNIETTAVVEAGMPLATCTSMGNLSLRGGNRKLPTMIFGGPVLCVASISDTDDKKDGYGHFYSRKSATSATMSSDLDGGKAATSTQYQATGPVLPYPDLVAWDDDGILCAIVVENRILVYVSNEPNFELLGTVRIGSPTMPMAEITNLKFVHGALFCCTFNSVHCVMLGDIEGTSICRFDTYLLASSDVIGLTENQPHVASSAMHSLVPTPLAIPLILPTILGYQSGSLLVSTVRGVFAIPLTSPLIRIGLLLGGGQTERAAKWFDAVDQVDHEALASFLERRGHPELALQLYGISLETIIDISMRNGYIERLEDAVETYGVLGLRAIDMGRGVTPNIFGQEEETLNETPSVVVCVGAYLLAHGRIELARRLATECVRSGEQGQRDALFLGALLLPVDESDATRLIQRAVLEANRGQEQSSKEWLMGNYVREFVLRSNSNPN